MSHISEQKKKPVPLYTKVGWVAAWLVMGILLIMILRNCVTSVEYGSQTGKEAVDSYHQLGISDGQFEKDFSLPDDIAENSVLRKAYIKGYREGLDRKRHLQ